MKNKKPDYSAMGIIRVDELKGLPFSNCSAGSLINFLRRTCKKAPKDFDVFFNERDDALCVVNRATGFGRHISIYEICYRAPKEAT